jgi:hypothetical protein
MIRNLSTEGRAANLLAGIEAEGASPGLYLPGLLRCPRERERHQRPDIYLENIFNTAGIVTHYCKQCIWIKGDVPLTMNQ